MAISSAQAARLAKIIAHDMIDALINTADDWNYHPGNGQGVFIRGRKSDLTWGERAMEAQREEDYRHDRRVHPIRENPRNRGVIEMKLPPLDIFYTIEQDNKKFVGYRTSFGKPKVRIDAGRGAHTEIDAQAALDHTIARDRTSARSLGFVTEFYPRSDGWLLRLLVVDPKAGE